MELHGATKSSGTGGGISTVTDGVTTVTSATTLTIVGGTVTNGGGGNAIVTFTGGSGAVSSVSNVDNSLTITPTTGAVVASLNTAHSNTWTVTQNFLNIGINKSAFTTIGADIYVDNSTLTQGIRIEGTIAAIQSFSTFISGDLNSRFAFRADGRFLWGDGTNGTDTNLYRTGVGILHTDGSFTIGTSLTVGTLTGLLKASSGLVSIATAGTDYLASASTDSTLQGNGLVATPLGFNLANSNTFTALQAVNLAGIANTPTDGFLLQNTTASTAGSTVQFSPSLHWQGTAWNTGSSTSQDVSVRQMLGTVSGTGVSGTWQLQASTNGGAYSNILQVTTGGSLVGSGNATFNGTFQTTTGTAGNSNLFIAGAITSNTATVSQYQFAGSSTVNLRSAFYGSTSTVIGVGNNYGSVIFANAPVTLPATGTNAMLANVVVKPLGTITVSGTSPTNTASLYIDGASTGTVTGGNYSLWANSGNVYLGSLFSGGLVKSTAGVLGLATAGTDYLTTLTGAITSSGNATSLGSFTSAQLSTALTDETGTGSAVFNNKPTFLGTIQTITAIPALALDGSTGNMFTKTIATGSTFTQSNFSVGQNFMVTVTGAFTITWFSGVTWLTTGGTAPTQAALTSYGFTCTGTNTFNGYLVATQ